MESWSIVSTAPSLHYSITPFAVRLRLRQGAVGDRGDWRAAVRADLARLLVKQARDLQAVGHLSKRDDRLDADGQFDVRVRLLAGADAFEPVLLVHPRVLGLEAGDRFRVDFLSELSLGLQLHPFAGRAHLEGCFVPEQAKARGGGVDRAAGDHGDEAAGELSEQLRVLRYLPLRRVGHRSEEHTSELQS